jgi:hypothetical protein
MALILLSINYHCASLCQPAAKQGYKSVTFLPSKRPVNGRQSRANVFNIVTPVIRDGNITALESVPMSVEFPLIIRDLTLDPSSEWSPRCNGWSVVRVAEGFGYCLHKTNATQLQAGDGFMSSQTTAVTVRASQLGALRLHYFLIQPRLLNGLLTVVECQQLETLSDNSSCLSPFRADEWIGQEFSKLVNQPDREKLAVRCALLQLWADGMAGLFGKPALNVAGEKKLRERFHQLMEQLPEAELMDITLADIAREIHCSERHLGHVFREKFGVSFRGHQKELRHQHVGRPAVDK